MTTRTRRHAVAKGLVSLGISRLMLIAIAFGVLGSVPYADAQLQPGDILVVDPGRGVLFRVDPLLGTHTVFSNFNDDRQGALGSRPTGVAVSASGAIYVIDSDAGTDNRGALFRVDPTNGHRTLWEDFGVDSEPLGRDPVGVAVSASGAIYVIDANAGTGEPEEGDPGNGMLFSGRTVVSDDLEEPAGVAVTASGEILVTDPGLEDADPGRLLRLSPSGELIGGQAFVGPNACALGRTVTNARPHGIAIEASGTVLMTAFESPGFLFRVDLSAPVGSRCRVLSNFRDDSQGEPGNLPIGVAVTASGEILVLDYGDGRLLEVNPQNGRRREFSNLRNPAEDPIGHSAAGFPTGIAIVSGVRPVEAPRPLIFVPGIAGSALDEDLGGGNSQNIWPYAMLQFEVLPRLTLDPTRTQRKIIAPDVLRTAVVNAPTGLPFPIDQEEPVYKPLLDMLTDPGRGGYRGYQVLRDPSLYTTTGCDLSQMPLNPTLFVFPYDWRKSNAESASALKDYIGCVQRFYPNSKIDILAHSMGGLVARRYILDNPGMHQVSKLITIGTPWLGAPKSFYLMHTGDFIVSTLPLLYTLVEGGRAPRLLQTYRALLEFFPGTHQLLPSRSLFSFEPLFFEDGWDINGNGVAREGYTYDQFISLLNERFRSAPGTTGRNFHDNLGQDDWRNDNSGIPYLHIVGIKKQADTIGKIFATRVSQCVGVIVKTCRSTNVIAVAMTVGDGTVPIESAERRLRDFSSTPPLVIQDLNAPGARVARFFNLPNDGSEHTKLTKSGDVHREILRFLGRGSSTSSVTTQALATASQIISSVAALDEEPFPAVEPALYLKVLGAMDVVVTDESGKPAQGVITYILGAEDSRLIVLDPDQEHTVTFRSGGDPLTLEITKSTDLTTTMAIRYHDLTLPAGAAAMLKVTPQAPLGVETLKYDSDGDGTFETAVRPTAVVEGPDAEDVEPPTVEFSAAEDPEGGPLAMSVDLTATDGGTGAKALWYSLDGERFLPYTGTLRLTPAQTPIVYAFAEDQVANRSAIFSFQLLVDLVPVLASPNSCTIQVTVENRGNTDAPASLTVIALIVEPPVEPGVVFTSQMPPIAAGGVVDISPINLLTDPARRVCSQGCDYTITVDAARDVEESNEGNNFTRGRCTLIE